LPSPPVMAGRRALALAEAPSGDIWVGGQGVALSADAGQSWQTITSPDSATHVLLPISDQTYGHGTHTHAAAWKQYLAELLKESEPN